MIVNGKVFASDFDRILEVKGNDKFLVEDSSDGQVKYASPSQINSKFEDLEADIETATEAAATATAKAAEASTYATNAANSAANSTSAKNNAQASATSAQNSASAAAASASQITTLYDAVDRVTAEHIVKLHEEIKALQELVKGLSDGNLHTLNLAAMPSACGCPFFLSGAGVPSATTIPAQKGVPAFVGQKYLDTSAKKEYTAFGVSAVSDWILI